VIIAQISDTHIDLENPDAASRIVDLERCVDDINRLDQLPDVVIHTGDITHNGTPEKYEVALGILNTLRRPFFLAAGNRDDRTLIRKYFSSGRELLPDAPYLQYIVDAFEIRLIALDTRSETTNMGNFCGVRADSLRQVLAEDTSKPTAIFMHHPPFEITQSKYPWQYDSQDAIALLTGVLEGQANVVRAFCGHSHRAASGMIAHVPVSCVPSVAIDLCLEELPDVMEAAPVYQIHKYDADQGFTTETRVAR
jgi:3',5'-cyclic-AMP phosphodiesterase